MTRSPIAPPADHIVLVGFMGAGKSTVGPLLAARLGVRFVDTDDLVTAGAGMNVRAIFETEGEAGFRRRERRYTLEACQGPPAVVGLGGGGFSDPDTRSALLAAARVVHLAASMRTCQERLAGEASGRPLLDAGFPRGLYEARAADYAAAHLSVPTDGRDPGEIAGEIVRRLRAEDPA